MMANREPVFALNTLKKHLFASIQFYLRKCFILIGQAAFTTEHGHFFTHRRVHTLVCAGTVLPIEFN